MAFAKDRISNSARHQQNNPGRTLVARPVQSPSNHSPVGLDCSATAPPAKSSHRSHPGHTQPLLPRREAELRSSYESSPARPAQFPPHETKSSSADSLHSLPACLRPANHSCRTTQATNPAPVAGAHYQRSGPQKGVGSAAPSDPTKPHHFV